MLRQTRISIFEADEALPTDQPPYCVHRDKGQAKVDSEDFKQCDHRSPLAEEDVEMSRHERDGRHAAPNNRTVSAN